ncbi:hypothetical protein DL770_010292 [Monosporascus sp. CRB-9-2]|nr:hypothetical protein DL770_010292 [Monosporascus sp. CRB-9-2]
MPIHPASTASLEEAGGWQTYGYFQNWPCYPYTPGLVREIWGHLRQEPRTSFVEHRVKSFDFPQIRTYKRQKALGSQTEAIPFILGAEKDASSDIFLGQIIVTSKKGVKAANGANRGLSDTKLDRRIFLRLEETHLMRQLKPAELGLHFTKELRLDLKVLATAQPVKTGWAVRSRNKKVRKRLLATGRCDEATEWVSLRRQLAQILRHVAFPSTRYRKQASSSKPTRRVEKRLKTTQYDNCFDFHSAQNCVKALSVPPNTAKQPTGLARSRTNAPTAEGRMRRPSYQEALGKQDAKGKASTAPRAPSATPSPAPRPPQPAPQPSSPPWQTREITKRWWANLGRLKRRTLTSITPLMGAAW